MGTYQQIAELTAELQDARLTKAERQAAIRQLHELQHHLELEEIDAVDSGNRAAADALFDQWSRIESALAA
jgi:hypothetical protein